MRFKARKALLILFLLGLCVWITAHFLDKLEDTSDRETSHPRDHSGPFPDDSMRSIHWFIQVSDIHISIYYDKKRVPDFEQFCTEVVHTIKPEVVLVTGDLTDAKHRDAVGSEQFEWEWKEYQRVLQETGVVASTVWLDLRGNHDAFNVPHLDHKFNYYRKYSAKGLKYPKHYKYTHETPESKFHFIAVDACPDPGPKRPFNFFGVMDKKSMEELEHVVAYSEGGNHTIFFGHYPSSTIIAPSPGLRSLFRKGTAYMSGHLHTLAGLAPNMYAMQKEGYLELECGDWKDNRIYRVFAMDHDLLSFTDTSLDKWPVILITNPKDAHFNAPLHEPLGRMAHSTHIRVLVFSVGRIESVTIKVNGQSLGQANVVQGPLYALAWNPESYLTGVHTIEVEVKDSLGNVGQVSQPFSLDNSRVPFSFLRRYVLMVHHADVGFWLYVLYTFCSLVPLMVIRRFRRKSQTVLTWLSSGRVCRFIGWWLHRLILLADDNTLYYSAMCFNIYTAIGPHFCGYLTTEDLGLQFPYGLYLRRHFIPGSLTYFYAAIQFLTYNVPVMFYLGHCRHLAIRESQSPGSSSILHNIQHHCIFVLIHIWQIYFTWTGLRRAYGNVAFCLSPVRTWPILAAPALRYWALNLHKMKQPPQREGTSIRSITNSNGVGPDCTR